MPGIDILTGPDNTEVVPPVAGGHTAEDALDGAEDLSPPVGPDAGFSRWLVLTALLGGIGIVWYLLRRAPSP